MNKCEYLVNLRTLVFIMRIKSCNGIKFYHKLFDKDEFLYVGDDLNIYDENNYLFEDWISDDHNGMRMRENTFPFEDWYIIEDIKLESIRPILLIFNNKDIQLFLNRMLAYEESITDDIDFIRLHNMIRSIFQFNKIFSFYKMKEDELIGLLLFPEKPSEKVFHHEYLENTYFGGDKNVQFLEIVSKT